MSSSCLLLLAFQLGHAAPAGAELVVRYDDRSSRLMRVKSPVVDVLWPDGTTLREEMHDDGTDVLDSWAADRLWVARMRLPRGGNVHVTVLERPAYAVAQVLVEDDVALSNTATNLLTLQPGGGASASKRAAYVKDEKEAPAGAGAGQPGGEGAPGGPGGEGGPGHGGPAMLPLSADLVVEPRSISSGEWPAWVWALIGVASVTGIGRLVWTRRRDAAERARQRATWNEG